MAPLLQLFDAVYYAVQVIAVLAGALVGLSFGAYVFSIAAGAIILIVLSIVHVIRRGVAYPIEWLKKKDLPLVAALGILVGYLWWAIERIFE